MDEVGSIIEDAITSLARELQIRGLDQANDTAVVYRKLLEDLPNLNKSLLADAIMYKMKYPDYTEFQENPVRYDETTKHIVMSYFNKLTSKKDTDIYKFLEIRLKCELLTYLFLVDQYSNQTTYEYSNE